MARRFKHLTKTDRLRMEQQLKDGKGAKEIAENLGVHISRYECKSNNHRKPVNSHVPL